MIFCFFTYDMGLSNKLYIIGGTIISIGLLFLLFKDRLYGYIGTIAFYGIQIFGTDLIFENFRYGLVLRNQMKFSLGSFEFNLDMNYSAVLLVVLGVLGYLRYNKLRKSETKPSLN